MSLPRRSAVSSRSWHDHVMPGRLTICATPIGNLSDISSRLDAALRDADVILAEDTRRTSTLLHHLGITTPTRSFFAGNERRRLDELAVLLSDGANVALVSDAGMPGISDPGASAVEVAVMVGAVVTAIPGPSAVTMALAVSGFDADRFVFAGFLSRKGRARKEELASIGGESRTVVVFAAPSRVDADLADLAAACGDDRRVVVTRELTKLHEELWRGSLRQAADDFSAPERRRGEFTIVISGATRPPPSVEEAVEAALGSIAGGMSRSDAIRDAASMYGVSKRVVYERVLGAGR